MGQVITELMIQISYDYAKKVFHRQIDLSHALNDITALSSMHRGLALAYVSNFQFMMEGSVYKRSMKTDATKYYLINIHKNYGDDYFRKALISISLHIDYYKNFKDANLTSIKRIVEGVKNREVFL
ncbi:hypothetical protein ABHN03_16760 [Paenibacillus sp. NRS-1775]|uniref:hypothetical protein n=1 Tax=unclassified Paenibacillus TaxID=185978 RepID=UPI003D29D08B